MDREAAKISALSTGELRKYEYLTGEELGYRPDIIQKAKFEYSLLGKVFNKGLDEGHKKEELLKKLKNIEDKNEQQYKQSTIRGKKQSETIRNQKEEQLDAISDQKRISISDKNRVENKSIFETIAEVSRSKNAKEGAEKLEKMDKSINYDELSITDKRGKKLKTLLSIWI